MIEEVKIGCWNCAVDEVKSGKLVCPDCGTEVAQYCEAYSHEKVCVENRKGDKRMTKEERNNKLKHLITCMKCEVSGKCCDENCPTQYNAGTMGEIIENLEEISKILEQETSTQKTG